MRLLRQLRSQIGWLLRRSGAEADLNDELQDYLERQTERYLSDGLSLENARTAALRDAGGVEQLKEECRDARGTLWLENTLQDIRYAWRTLSRNRGFAVAAICTLALGIGANTAIFDVISGVLLRPLPYRDSNQLVDVEQTLRTGEFSSFSYPDYLDCAHDSHPFESIAAWRNRGANLTFPGEPAFLSTRLVSASFLDVLGVQPVLGRNFTPGEDQYGAASVAIINYALWQERFGGRRDAIGARMVLNGNGYTVIGVLPSGFRFFDDRPVLTPIGQQSGEITMQRRDLRSGIQAIARLKPGVTLQKANTELTVVADRLQRTYPDADANFTFRAISLKEQIVGNIGRTLFLLGGAVGLVLLIACVNVANLFLARSISREREFAVRTALGAGRWRLSRQLLTESLLLSFAGGAAGLIVASAGTRWAIAHLPQWLPRTNEISIDVRVLLFTLGASVLSGIAFGMAPAFRERFELETTLRQGARGNSAGVRRIQGSFVIAELALAFVLLAGAGLMLRTISQLWSISPGFDPHNILTMTAGVSPNALKNTALLRNAWQQMLDRVRNTPGVQAAVLDGTVPLSGDSQAIGYWTSAALQPPKDAPNAFLFTPTPGYLETMRIPLLRGRFFTEQDRIGSASVIVIDDTLAKRLFRDKDPVGSELSVQFIGRARIIGVVGAIKHRTLDEDADAPPQPTIYMPFLQFPESFMPLTATGMNLLVRTSVTPSSVIQAVKKRVAGPAQDETVRDVATMEQIIGDSMAQRRGIAFLLAIFAALALVLSAIGIYSVISYAMGRRVQEIGIRMALGAQPRQVLRLVLVQGLRTIGAGVALGLVASFGVTRLLSKLLFGVTPADPLTFAAVLAALCSIALFAVYFPARRAARVDPSMALRHE